MTVIKTRLAITVFARRRSSKKDIIFALVCVNRMIIKTWSFRSIKKQSIAVVVGMLFVAASLNEVEAGDLSKIANVSIQVREASDLSEEYSAKLELIELVVNASGLPENYVALWVDSQVKPQ